MVTTASKGGVTCPKDGMSLHQGYVAPEFPTFSSISKEGSTKLQLKQYYLNAKLGENPQEHLKFCFKGLFLRVNYKLSCCPWDSLDC